MTTQKTISNIWDVFQQSIEDKSVDEFEYVKYRTKQKIVNTEETNNIVSVIDFEIDDLNSFYQINKGFVEVNFKIVNNTDGADLDPEDVVTLCSNAQQIFEKAEFRLGNKLIEEIQEVGHASLAKNLIEYSKEYCESVSESEWFYPETSNYRYGAKNNQDSDVPTIRGGGAQHLKYRFVDGDQNLKNINAGYNVSFNKRHRRTQQSSVVQIFIPLARIFGFCQSYKQVINGLRQHYRFNRNCNYASMLHGRPCSDPSDDQNNNPVALTPDARLVITEMNLWIPTVKPSIEALRAIIQGSQVAKPIQFNFISWNAYFSQDYPANTSHVNYRVPPVTGIPKMALVGIQDINKYTVQNDSFTGLPAGDRNFTLDEPNADGTGQNASNNPLAYIAGGIGEFGSNVGIDNINNIIIRVNGKEYPVERYDLGFNSPGKGDLYGRAYHEFLRTAKKSPYGGEACIVDHTTYKYIYPLIPFEFDEFDDEPEIEVEAQFLQGTIASQFRMVVMLATQKSKDIVPIGDKVAIMN